MGKPTPSAPVAPDPTATAAAQGAMNQNTAISQQFLNQTDQITPDGSLKYTQDGSSTFLGADGKTYTVPKFTATTSLSPAGQALYDTNNQTKQNIAGIGKDQSAKIGALLGTNLKLGNEATESRLMELGSKRLDPMFARSEDALRTRLSNQGIMPGSAAWQAEMSQFSQGKNDAYSQLLLTGRGQANNEIMAERNQPINEISALMSGSQVSNPNFTSTPTTQVAGVDYTGLVNNNYNAANQQYQTQLGQQNAAMGGMFGLAGTLGSAAMKYGPLLAASDRRLKSDIQRIGTTKSGFPLYEYTIFGERQRGVMADEVKRIIPEAVHRHESGFDMVDYAMVGV